MEHSGVQSKGHYPSTLFGRAHVGDKDVYRSAYHGRYHLENGVSPRKFSVPETLEADLLDNFDTIKILLSTLGFTLFESVVKEPRKSKNTYVCQGVNAKAEGEYQEDGFVVYKGSTANKALSKSASLSVKNNRNKILRNNTLVENGNVYVFTDNYLFKSPSAAACVVLARNANGWIEWKDHTGRTLDEVKRK